MRGAIKAETHATDAVEDFNPKDPHCVEWPVAGLDAQQPGGHANSGLDDESFALSPTRR